MAPDPRIEEPYRLTPQTLLRTGILGAITLALFAVLFLRLWSLEVLSNKQYLATAQSNQLRVDRVEAPRGLILDDAGRPIVANRSSQAIQVRPAELPKKRADQNFILHRLASTLHVPFLPIRRAIDERLGRGDVLTPVVVKRDVNRYLEFWLKEHATSFPGVVLGPTYVRTYPHGTLAAHILGYVGEVSAAELDADQKHRYHLGDIVGQAGLEYAYDDFLRGTPGREVTRFDALNKVQRTVINGKVVTKRLTVAPKPGYNIRLTLDLKLQRAAENALLYGIQEAHLAHEWYANGGAIVALDPRDGAVRALASYPTFKPSMYTGRVTMKALQRAGLAGGPKGDVIAKQLNYPGLDRATMGIYAPGSTFKPMTAIAGLETPGVLSAGELIPCPGSKVYDGHKFSNWDPYSSGVVDLATALEISCDTYFYEVGDRIYKLGAARHHPIQDMARQFGFGERTGIDVGGEATGLLPTPEWRKKTYTKARYPDTWEIERLWKSGDSIQLAIGQKDLRVTPLQMARFYAALANGGKVVTPHVFAYAEQSQGVPLPQSRKLPAAPRKINLRPGVLDAIRAGLYKATHDPNGTSSAIFGTFPVPIVGKTGTAEQVVNGALRSQSWWCGFGPVDSPKLVVCALIENGGHGGTAAAPAARMVFEQFFHKTGETIGTVKSD